MISPIYPTTKQCVSNIIRTQSCVDAWLNSSHGLAFWVIRHWVSIMILCFSLSLYIFAPACQKHHNLTALMNNRLFFAVDTSGKSSSSYLSIAGKRMPPMSPAVSGLRGPFQKKLVPVFEAGQHAIEQVCTLSVSVLNIWEHLTGVIVHGWLFKNPTALL